MADQRYKPISSYGLIGDMHTAVLVGQDGSIDWGCLPRFDSPSTFAVLLDSEQGGYWQISPVAEHQSKQTYVANTNILRTTFTTLDGQAELIDFMPLTSGNRPGPEYCPHEVHRVVSGKNGKVEMVCRFQPRLDYGRAMTHVALQDNGAMASSDQESVSLSTDVPLVLTGHGAEARFVVTKGQAVTFVLSYGRQVCPPIADLDTTAKLTRTQRFWESVAAQVLYGGYRGRWQREVVRSFLALHLLMYSPTGAIVAAPTTSLPESIGGERNWDYRYAWLRDAVLTLGVFYRLGDRKDGHKFFRWLIDRCKIAVDDTQILYGIDPASDTTERMLAHLSGYKDSGPVRTGNAAAEHFQLDVYGEVILSIATYYRYGGRRDRDTWSIVERFANTICENWRRKDTSIWEVRGPERHFVYSKVMCWAGLNKAIALALQEHHSTDEAVHRWEQCARDIQLEVLRRGWSDRKQAFVQAYDSEELDASVLIISLVGFLPANDPRVLSTIQCIRDELGKGALLQRYDTKTSDDGISGDEGAFILMSFWLMSALKGAGYTHEADELFAEVAGYANHIGLLSEMMDPNTGEALGNFPQALSHIGLIHAACNLAPALGQRKAEFKVA
jgi:GH15 family glucan-1,4-alpha-glucosidase